MKSECLVVITKYPITGNVKTRLGEEIGLENAANFNRAMIKDLVRVNLNQSYDLAIETNDIKHEYDLKLLVGNDIQIRSRLNNYLRGSESNTFEVIKSYLQDYSKIIVVFSDVPGIDNNLVELAFRKLDKKNVVVGSDIGGGYYLLGMNKAFDLFTSLPESRCQYYNLTLNLLRERKINFDLIKPLQDIDRVEDIRMINWDDMRKIWVNTYDLVSKLRLDS